MSCFGKVLSNLKKSLKIDAWAIRDDFFCNTYFFKVYIHGSDSMPSFVHVVMVSSRSLHQVITPKIYTADENLRSISSKQWVATLSLTCSKHFSSIQGASVTFPTSGNLNSSANTRRKVATQNADRMLQRQCADVSFTSTFVKSQIRFATSTPILDVTKKSMQLIVTRTVKLLRHATAYLLAIRSSTTSNRITRTCKIWMKT